MLRLEGYVEIQVLRRQRKIIRAISAELGVARRDEDEGHCSAAALDECARAQRPETSHEYRIAEGYRRPRRATV